MTVIEGLKRERRTTIILATVCFLLIIAAVYATYQVQELRQDVNDQAGQVSRQQKTIAQQQNTIASQQRQSYKGCVRGNVLRAQVRYALIQLGAADSARLPEISEQNCARLYPEGAPK